MDGVTSPLGLKNYGNTCFLNVVLQSLAHCQRVVSLARSSSDGCGLQDCVLCAMLTCISTLRRPAVTTSGLDIFVRRWIGLLGTFYDKSLVIGRQEDAHEFLTSMIFAFGSDKEDSCKAVHSPIAELFQGKIRSSIFCRQCQCTSNTIEQMIGLELFIQPDKDLRRAIEDFCRIESLAGHNAYSCSTCKTQTSAQKGLTLETLPSIIPIQLKRFSYENYECRKINASVDYPAELDLSPYVWHNLDKTACSSASVVHPEDCYYMLKSFVVHVGETADSGHYIAYVLRHSPQSVYNQQQWYRIDDDKVTAVEHTEAFRQLPYILFYERIPAPRRYGPQSTNGATKNTPGYPSNGHSQMLHTTGVSPRVASQSVSPRRVFHPPSTLTNGSATQMMASSSSSGRPAMQITRWMPWINRSRLASSVPNKNCSINGQNGQNGQNGHISHRGSYPSTSIYYSDFSQSQPQQYEHQLSEPDGTTVSRSMPSQNYPSSLKDRSHMEANSTAKSSTTSSSGPEQTVTPAATETAAAKHSNVVLSTSRLSDLDDLFRDSNQNAIETDDNDSDEDGGSMDAQYAYKDDVIDVDAIGIEELPGLEPVDSSSTPLRRQSNKRKYAEDPTSEPQSTTFAAKKARMEPLPDARNGSTSHWWQRMFGSFPSSAPSSTPAYPQRKPSGERHKPGSTSTSNRSTTRTLVSAMLPGFLSSFVLGKSDAHHQDRNHRKDSHPTRQPPKKKVHLPSSSSKATAEGNGSKLAQDVHVINVVDLSTDEEVSLSNTHARRPTHSYRENRYPSIVSGGAIEGETGMPPTLQAPNSMSHLVALDRSQSDWH